MKIDPLSELVLIYKDSTPIAYFIYETVCITLDSNKATKLSDLSATLQHAMVNSIKMEVLNVVTGELLSKESRSELIHKLK